MSANGSWTYEKVLFTTADYQKPPNPWNNKKLIWILFVIIIILVALNS